jgi:hypothetical protein
MSRWHAWTSCEKDCHVELNGMLTVSSPVLMAVDGGEEDNRVVHNGSRDLPNGQYSGRPLSTCDSLRIVVSYVVRTSLRTSCIVVSAPTLHAWLATAPVHCSSWLPLPRIRINQPTWSAGPLISIHLQRGRSAAVSHCGCNEALKQEAQQHRVSSLEWRLLEMKLAV